MEEKLRPTMLDPSLLCIFEFWESSTNLQDFFPVIYFPQSIAQIEDRELQDFYGGYRWGILSVDEMVRRSQEAFKPFSWKDYSEEVPQELRGGFEKLRRLLEESILPKPILHILLDEFVFLATQSSILSRLKKAFVLFENFDAIPLLNLERKIP